MAKTMPINRSGQQIIEYLLLISIIILALLTFIRPQGLFQRGLQSSLNKSFRQLSKEVYGPVSVRCESMDFIQSECLVSPLAAAVTGVTLVDQESTNPCTSGSTFGPMQPNKIFVNGGCRGVFEVTFTIP